MKRDARAERRRSSSRFVFGATLALCSCGGRTERLPELEIRSDIVMDTLLLTVLAPKGALVFEERIAPVQLPGRVRVDPSGRSGTLRVLVWGLLGDERVAFGTGPLSVDAQGAPTPLQLGAAPVDSDLDGFPDAHDDCPDTPDSSQADLELNGVPDACDPTRLCPNNLASNGSFDVDLAGWSAIDGSASWNQVGRNGRGGAARVCRPGVESAFEGSRVRQPLRGATYRLGVWVRAEGSTSQEISISLRAMSNGALLSSSPEPSLTPRPSAWLYLETELVTDGAADALEFELYAPAGHAGECFLADDVCLKQEGVP